MGVLRLHGEVSAGMLQRSCSLWLGSLGLIEDAVHLCNLLLVFDFGLKIETARWRGGGGGHWTNEMKNQEVNVERT